MNNVREYKLFEDNLVVNPINLRHGKDGAEQSTVTITQENLFGECMFRIQVSYPYGDANLCVFRNFLQENIYMNRTQEE